jgi:multicomponent Na+:H+ antiporter subunit E
MDLLARYKNNIMQLKKLYRLIITLIIFWLLLSGIFTPMLLILGVISIVLVCYFSVQMKVLEHRGQPIYFRPFHLVRYWCWLIFQIVKSNWDVTQRILSPSLPIKPILKTVPATQKTEIGRIIYANSITLTPGTVAINIAKNGDILVHALHEDSIAELEEGAMADRVCILEPQGADHKVGASKSGEAE